MSRATAVPAIGYARAARFLKDWLREGILREEDHPAFYVYHQTFDVDGKRHTRKGFLARVRLEPIGKGKIYPHEQTLAGPEGRPACSLSCDRLQPQSRFRALSRHRPKRFTARSRRGCAIALPSWRPIISASRTGSGS